MWKANTDTKVNTLMKKIQIIATLFCFCEIKACTLYFHSQVKQFQKLIVVFNIINAIVLKVALNIIILYFVREVTGIRLQCSRAKYKREVTPIILQCSHAKYKREVTGIRLQCSRTKYKREATPIRLQCSQAKYKREVTGIRLQCSLAKYKREVQILDRIRLKYATNANETNEK